LPKYILVASAAMLSLLAACGARDDKPVKREPGSWSTKITIGKLEGKGVTAQTKAGLQQMFDAMSSMSVCVTPEASAREDIGHNIENASGAGRNCQFDKRDLAGETISFSGTCSDGTRKVRMTATGTTGATAQDMTMTIEPLGTNGAPEGIMEMHMATTRSGACKPTDITPPPPAAPAAPAGATK
jgi:hypothetical protein